jgi:hypothetical protein
VIKFALFLPQSNTTSVEIYEEQKAHNVCCFRCQARQEKTFCENLLRIFFLFSAGRTDKNPLGEKFKKRHIHCDYYRQSLTV